MMVSEIGGGWPCTGAGAGSTITFCCSLVLRLPESRARARRRCTAASTSRSWARNASPSFCVQSSLSLIGSSTCGKATSDFTLTSHVWFSTALTAASPFTLGLALTQRAACTISSGYVDAISTWESTESG
ncbi:hypothetical protein D3C87_1135090 [compost metagenome]